MATIHQAPELSAFPGYIEVSRRFDQTGSGTGPVWTIEYRGTKDAIRIATLGWSSIGAKYSTIEEGPYASATVIFSGPTADPGDPIDAATVPVAGQETPDIRYEFRTDYLDVSLFALPAVADEAQSIGDPAFYKKTIEDAVASGQQLTDVSPLANLPLARKVFQKLCRGEESFPVGRVSLSRVAMFSGSLGLPQVPQSIPPVYTPAIRPSAHTPPANSESLFWRIFLGQGAHFPHSPKVCVGQNFTTHSGVSFFNQKNNPRFLGGYSVGLLRL